MFEALIRVSSYSNVPEEASAGAALEQLQIAVRGGVSYLNGGWQTLVERLRHTAEDAGVNLRSDVSAQSVEHELGQVYGIRLSNGTRIPGR
jgi:phytoene dehydrogenase-like protein